MPKLSVIVLSYNSENTIEKTIESVLSQSCKDFELILVDQNSKDKTLEIAGKYKNSISKWISEPCKSDYDAMNKGILLALGEYILFLNSGDTLSNNDILEKITSQFNDEDIICGNINFDGKIKKVNYKKNYSLCDEKTYISAEFIKRSFLEQLGGFDTRFKFLADYEFNLRSILKNKAELKYIDEVISDISKNEEILLKPQNARRYFKEKKVIQRAYFNQWQIFIYKILNIFFK